MKVYEQILGNLSDPEWSHKLEGAVIATLLLDEWEQHKPRLRRTTSDGMEIAINLERGVSMQDGDILEWDPVVRRTVTVKVRVKEVMHIRLEPAEPMAMVERALKLGHALGNQHWPALVQGSSIYVPLRVDKRVMSTVLKTQNIPGVSYDFESGSGLNLPYADPGEHAHPHSHSHDGSSHDRAHSHGDD